MFGHLQVKSAYSFQRSTILIKQLVEDAYQKHIPALALVDKNNMYGAYEFYEECVKKGIKPIFGLEADVKIHGEIYPFIILAKNDIGYKDLIKINCDINLNDDKSIDLESLSIYKQHIFIISGNNEGIVERLVVKEMEDEAIKYMKLFKEMFKDNYYLMLQDHMIAHQRQLNTRLIAIAKYTNVKIICSNDVCYLRKSDALALDLMKASALGQTLDYKYEPMTKEKYLKTEEEMKLLFNDEIIEETKNVIKLCNASLSSNQMHLPTYPINNAKDYLMRLCITGLKKRFNGLEVPKNYIQRLKYELEVIHQMGFDDYFLIVFDYVRYAKRNSILVGPGRGSAAGSLVAYVLGITNVDPIAYDLLFERFLNPERVSMPDIDIDFQDDRRDEVVNYVIEKYGQDHVCQIVTFNTYGPRVAIKDMGKVMGIPLARLEILAKMVPTNPKNKKTITQMYETSAQFQSMVNADPLLRKLIPAMSVIEHLPRNISTHAAGVVLSSEPLREVVPLVKGPTGTLMSQYSKDYIEKAGLLKMDFLGLKNLTMLDYIIQDIYKDTGRKINLNELGLNDQKTYQLISQAYTYGIFQLESTGMRNLLRRMKPRSFDDIVAAIALYRPGPMENIPAYLNGRANPKEVTYLLPEMKPILESTYGIMVYQEQLMMIAQKIAGFSLGKADILRKAVSKKQLSLMESLKDEFIQGCIDHGYKREKAIELYALIEKFANYGFNKSHSVAYAYVAYQLAYLKANEPLYFFAAILSNEMSSENTKINVLQECKAYKVKVLPPSINHSYHRFMVENGHIRYSLLAIKNVGYALYKAIIEEREKGLFKDIYDFVRRMDSSRISKKTMESLIDAGCFDEFDMNRSTIKNNLDTIIEYGNLMNTLGIEEKPILNIVKENEIERLDLEKEVLGVYLSMHPIEIIKGQLPVAYVNISALSELTNRGITIVGQITRVKNITDKNGNEMCFVEILDETGSIEGVVFASTYKNIGVNIKKGNICMIYGKANNKDKLSFVVENVRVIK